jgi:hypothetical protein
MGAAHCVSRNRNNCHRLRCERAGADYFFEKFREFDQVAGVFRKMAPGAMSRNEMK